MRKYTILFALLLFFVAKVTAQDIEKNVEERLNTFFKNYTCSAQIGKCRLNKFAIDYENKTLAIYTSESFAFQPFVPENVESIYHSISQLLPGPVCYFKTTIFSGGKPIEELIPNIYRKKKKDKSRLFNNVNYEDAPWVENTSRPNDISKGLQNRHIALWQSHGKYFKNNSSKWLWQRPRLYCTTEDLFTQSIILPYVIPMLENAGANVFTPRERDTQKNEVIADNDQLKVPSLYIEGKSRKNDWNTSDVPGFKQKRSIYNNNENPFNEGTIRYTHTEKKKNKAFAEWVPDFPENGKYAVYVTYKTLPESVSDAKYLVFHNGGVTEFKVNQQIGGGTWVYLGTFSFDKGCNDYGMVVLSNQSEQKV